MRKAGFFYSGDAQIINKSWVIFTLLVYSGLQ